MHHRLVFLYDCTCDVCNHTPETLNLSASPFKQLLNTVERAFKQLHKKGSYHPDDLDQVKEYQDLIFETNKVFNKAFKDNDLSPKMLESLQNDVFYFSGLKTHAQLFEASRLLLTEDKTIKSFASFSKDIATIKKSYNENYLEAEYDFAVGSIQMAERWELFDKGDRYVLQYRTAGDDKVRASHQVLHNITLPKDDPFWDLFFPPNGWRCRCTVIEVLKALAEIFDSKEAIKRGNAATTQIGKNGKNKLEIFRFNSGKQQVVFPPDHPYNKVAGANKVRTITKAIGAKASQYDENGFKELHKYKGGGSVHTHRLINDDDSDYKPVLASAQWFAKYENAKVELMPKAHFKSNEYQSLYSELKNTPYYKKCPDLRVNGKFYEHEGFEGNDPKSRLKKMLNRGVKQSNRLIIENPEVTEAYLLRNIKDRIFIFKQDIKEVWVKQGDKLTLIYKNAKTQ